MVLGTDDATQLLAFGVVENDADTVTAEARQSATSTALAKLNLINEPSSPSQRLTDAVNLLAASILNKDKDESAKLEEKGMKLLELLRGDDESDGEWGNLDVF